MRFRTKLLFTALAATAIMAAVVGVAAARRLAVNSTDVYIIWRPLSFAAPIGENVNCDVTLLGSFHSLTISKVNNSLIGYVTHASVNNCQNGNGATVHDETLPWHITYESFGGVLPAISSVALDLHGASFEIENGITCSATTTLAEPGRGTAAVDTSTGVVDSVAASGSIDLEGGGLCDFLGPNGEFSGSGTAADDTDGVGSLIIRLV